MSQFDKATKTAKDYYDSEDADNFYSVIWGGEDIHIGLYENPKEEIAKASQLTITHMAKKLNIQEGEILLDIGSGYGGAVRSLAKSYPLKAIALNLSQKENERNISLNKASDLDGRIQVLEGSFEDIPLENESVDYVWSQDAILHSGNRKKVLQEVARVLKKGGSFIFTDPMRKDHVKPESLEAILNRIHLQDLGCPNFYLTQLRDLGFSTIEFEERSQDLIHHYSRVLEETEKNFDTVVEKISRDYLEKMKIGLGHWIIGGKEDLLTWGVFLAKK